MSDLVTFLNARLDEREQLARSVLEERASSRAGGLTSTPWDEEDAGARQSLREVAALRAVLAEHRTIAAEYPDLADSPDSGACGGCGLNMREDYRVADINDCPTLQALALIWEGGTDD